MAHQCNYIDILLKDQDPQLVLTALAKFMNVCEPRNRAVTQGNGLDALPRVTRGKETGKRSLSGCCGPWERHLLN